MKSVYMFSPGGRSAPGGMARMVDYTLRLWPETSPYRIRVVDTYGPGPKYLMPIVFVLSIIILCSALATRRVDIVHVNMSERLSVWRKLILTQLARMFTCPTVVHIHGAEFIEYCDRSSPIVRERVRRALCQSTLIVVLGSLWRGFLTEKLGVSPTRVKVLWNAVPEGNLKRQEVGRPCRFLFVGRVCRRKGVDRLLTAFSAKVLVTMPWESVIVGDGEVPAFEAIAAGLGLKDRVRFVGPLQESLVRIEFAGADVVVLPSRNEGLPLAILEAMAFGLPVVASSVGSIADAVIDGETGFLIQPDDDEGLAAAMARLASDASLRLRFGQAGRTRYEAHFSLENYARSLEAIYDAASRSEINSQLIRA